MKLNIPLAITMIVCGTILGEAIVLAINVARAERMSLPEAEAKGIVPAEKRRPAPAVTPPKATPGITISRTRRRE